MSRNPGVVTKVLLGLLVLGFVAQQASPLVQARLQLIGLAVDPQLHGDTVGVAVGQWYRLLSVTLVHGGLLHIAFNGYALWLFGPPVELALGRARYVALWVVSALGGSAASFAFSQSNRPSVGASGAIFGLLAALLVIGRHQRRDLSGLVVLIGLNVVVGAISPTIDWRAHIGGFLAGGAVALVMAYAPSRRRTLLQAVGTGVIALVALGMVLVHSAHLVNRPELTVLRCTVVAPLDPTQNAEQCLTRS